MPILANNSMVLTASDMAAAVGVTYQHVDRLTRVGLITCSYDHPDAVMRRYTSYDVLVLMIVQRLLNAGFNYPTVRNMMSSVVDVLHDYDSAPDDQPTMLLHDGQQSWLSSDADEVHACAVAGVGVMVLPLSELIATTEQIMTAAQHNDAPVDELAQRRAQKQRSA